MVSQSATEMVTEGEGAYFRVYVIIEDAMEGLEVDVDVTVTIGSAYHLHAPGSGMHI